MYSMTKKELIDWLIGHSANLIILSCAVISRNNCGEAVLHGTSRIVRCGLVTRSSHSLWLRHSARWRSQDYWLEVVWIFSFTVESVYRAH